MAWEINSANRIDYSPNGDDVGTAWPKAMAIFNQIFVYLNQLRNNNAVAGISESGTSAYETRIDTTTGTIYMRNAANTQWLMIGRVGDFMGIKPEDIGAVANGGGMEKISLGLDASIPQTDNDMYDGYLAVDTGRFYVWFGSDWHIMFSLDFKDMKNYEDYVVSKAEVAYNGNGKIPRLDRETGKGLFSITGSPERILERCLNLESVLHDDDVLVYDATTDKWTTRSRTDGVFTEADITYTGEAGKIPKISNDGYLHANIDGGTTKILNIPIDATNLRDG